MKTDSLFYRLFQEHPEVVFELAGWPLPANAGYTLQAEEVKQTSFRLDGLLTPAGADPTLPLVFIEIQFQRKVFYPRWFSEIFLYLYRRNIERPWWAVVIFPNRAAEVEPSPAYRALFDLPGVQRVYLEDFTERPATTPGLQLVQLLVAEPANAVAQARTLLITAETQPDDTASWSFHDLIETILVYKLPQLTREEIQAMLHLPDIDLKQTRFYQQAMAEGGQCEAAALVLRQLHRRLGVLEVEQEARIQTLPVLELEALAEALLEFQTSDELTAWLRQRL
jgi:predicted transposase/invertase (TIGR01784 family)